MIRSKHLLAGALIVLAGAHAELRAQQAPAQPQNALLQRLVGHWRMVGEVRGTPVTYALVARRILNGSFVELHMTDTRGAGQYEAMVLIGEDTVPNRVYVHWLDKFGGAYSVPAGDGRTSGDTLVFDIPYPERPFRDTIVVSHADGSWTFRLDASDGHGGWKRFADYEVQAVH